MFADEVQIFGDD